MQHQSAPPAIEQGVPSETRWSLPNGFGSIDLPPEEGGLPKEIGEIRQNLFPLRPGLEVYTFAATIKSPVTISYEVLTGQPYLWLSYTFSGQPKYKHGSAMNGVASADLGCCAMLRDPTTLLVYAPDEHKAAGVAVTPDRLREMLQGQHLSRPIDDFIDGKFDPSVAMPRPTATLRNISNHIFNHPYQGAMASVFLEAKALEMLAEFLSHLIDSPARSCPSSPARRRALAARDFIMDNLADPPRIEDVARQVGLSQRHLAELFQDLFGASPLQCLTQWRLEQAHALLARGDLSVKQVAHMMGYAHVSSFSYAYGRHFGHSPSSAG